jgi:imidazole glycerol-phosphate synthase subunit HisF
MDGLTKRLIVCLDVKDGRTVKGVRFEGLVDAGDPVQLAERYVQQGADELVFLDIAATNESRKTFLGTVESVAAVLDIPFAVGGGVTSVADAYALLNAGADKVGVNSAAVRRPELLEELAKNFGSQCVVLAIDAREVTEKSVVHVNGGRAATERETIEWAREGANRGAGEILLTSMDHDGTRAGFALALTAAVSAAVDIPVIASGGAGEPHHFVDVLRQGQADAALAAGIFHTGALTIPDLKVYLAQRGIPIRP